MIINERHTNECLLKSTENILSDQSKLDETFGLTLSTFRDPRGLGIEINGKKYVYDITDEDRDTFFKMKKYSDGKALAWIKPRAKKVIKL